MKILIVANYALSNQESMQRFANMLEEGLIAEGYDVQLIRPEPVLCKGSQAERGIAKWLGYIDRFLLFRTKLKRAAKSVDVVHICDHSNAMYAKWIKKPTLVTCHDMMAVQSALGMVANNETGLTGQMLQKWISSGLRACDYIACVSNNTRNELLSTLDISPSNVFVAYNALNYPYSPMSHDEAHAILYKRLPELKSPFFFHLGGNQWYKNRKGVAEIYSELIQYDEYQEHKLVLAGKPWSLDLRNAVNSLGIDKHVVEISDLSNEEVRAFYSVAEALIFPSLQEGFGWPIAEAQACGCKVITTGRAPMAEVGGEAAIYINPEKPVEAAELIHDELLSKVDSPNSSVENARRFSLESMVESYRYGYEQVMRIY